MGRGRKMGKSRRVNKGDGKLVGWKEDEKRMARVEGLRVGIGETGERRASL